MEAVGATNGYALIDEGGPARGEDGAVFSFRPNNSGNAEAAITASATSHAKHVGIIWF